jgi:transglutaminase-like putative cysteine protease
MLCEVEVSERPDPSARPRLAWEAVCGALLDEPAQDGLRPVRMAEPSTLVPWSDAAYAYASESLGQARDWLDAVTDLMRRIHREFEFDTEATTVTTSVDEVLAQKKGVCQDFAHVMIACLRSHGLPARYISGYLLTQPPPGRPRLLGADASHAWVAAYSPSHGWVEFDPTNDTLADRRYITLASGADFADVVPLRGVILGGRGQTMKVAVSVVPR